MVETKFCRKHLFLINEKDLQSLSFWNFELHFTINVIEFVDTVGYCYRIADNFWRVLDKFSVFAGLSVLFFQNNFKDFTYLICCFCHMTLCSLPSTIRFFPAYIFKEIRYFSSLHLCTLQHANKKINKK